MSKTFAESFAILPAPHDTVKPSDVSGLTAAAAADALLGKGSPALRGQALVRALVESAYGTPLVKSLITANKRSSAARNIAQCWPALPACKNSKSAPRLLSAIELSAAIATMAVAFDKLAADQEANRAAAKAANAVTVSTPASAEEGAAVDTMDAKAEDNAIATIDLFRALLAEAASVRSMPKDLKERIKEALAV